MNDMSPAGIGHNAPPDPLDDAIALFSADREEAETWLDGKTVEDEAQMNAVDALSASMRDATQAIKDAKEGEYRPYKDGCDAVVTKYKPTLEDHARITTGLVSLVSDFKKKMAAKAAEETRLAWIETERLRKEAEAKQAAANPANIEEQREVAAAKEAAMQAESTAKQVAKTAPKRMRNVTHHEVMDMQALVNHIAKTDKPALAEFAAEYARKNHASIPDAVVRTWTTKEAF